MKRVLALAFVVAVCARCAESEAGATPAPGPDTPGSGILFVGNSLTYTEDLPGLVAALATAAGRPVATASVAYPDYSLEDH